MFKRDVFGICLRYAKDRAEGEDMMQEAFIRVYTDLYQYRPIGPFGGWVRRVTINSCLRYIRKRNRLVFNDKAEAMADAMPASDDILGRLAVADLVKWIQKLPEGYRLVFNLFVVEGYSHKEIADELGISVNTSKSQLFRAKAHLRKTLEKVLI